MINKTGTTYKKNNYSALGRLRIAYSNTLDELTETIQDMRKTFDTKLLDDIKILTEFAIKESAQIKQLEDKILQGV